jgi:hypothetical protein
MSVTYQDPVDVGDGEQEAETKHLVNGVEALEVDDSEMKSPIQWVAIPLAILIKICGRCMIILAIISIGFIVLWKSVALFGTGVVAFFFGAGLERLVAFKKKIPANPDL